MDVREECLGTIGHITSSSELLLCVPMSGIVPVRWRLLISVNTSLDILPGSDINLNKEQYSAHAIDQIVWMSN